MFLQNFYNTIKTFLLTGAPYGKSYFGENYQVCGLPDTDSIKSVAPRVMSGTCYYNTRAMMPELPITLLAPTRYSDGYNNWSAGPIFSTEDTPVSVSDYTMNGVITTLTFNSAAEISGATINDDGSISFKMIYTFTNSSGSSVTIRKIGLTTLARNNNTQATDFYTASNEKKYLLYAEVLESPLEILDGDTFSVTMEITIPNITPEA